MKTFKLLIILLSIAGAFAACHRTDTGAIKVTSVPSNAHVYLDDTLTGWRTDCVLADIEPGKHTILVTLDGYSQHQEVVEVIEGDTTEVHAELAGEYGYLRIESDPEGADIWLDSVRTGEVTNFLFEKVAMGEHVVHLTLIGYMDWDATINIIAGDTFLLHAPLVANSGTVIVNTTPQGADVYLDDTLMAEKTNCVLEQVVPGDYSLRVELENYDDWDTTFYIQAGDTLYFDFQLIEVKWKYLIGSDARSTPAIGTDGTIYVGSVGGLHAFTPDGANKWNFELSSRTPTVGEDGTIYYGAYEGWVGALNPDGSEKWRYGEGIGQPVWSSPGITSDGTMYIGAYEWGHYFYSFDPDGNLNWRILTWGFVEASPSIASDGTIYVGIDTTFFWALNPDSTLKWSYDGIDWVVSSPAIDYGGTIYFGSRDGYLYALSPDGNLEWKYLTGGWVRSCPVIGSDGTIYIGSDDGYLYALTPSGNLKWRYNIGSEIWGRPVVGADGTIYLGSSDPGRYLHAFAPDGTLKWCMQAESAVRTPMIADDGTLYFGTEAGFLYAIPTESYGLASSPWPSWRHDQQNTGRAR